MRKTDINVNCNKGIKNREKLRSEIKVYPNVSRVTEDGFTYIRGVLVVNKKYNIPPTYNPGINKVAFEALKDLQADANTKGYSMSIISGFRSYDRQTELYNEYVLQNGKDVADTFSAKPGHSEHQTGLAFDVGNISDEFGNTEAGMWLASNSHNYGFIIRYPKGKENITGYKYEPWHIRYVGTVIAKEIYNNKLCLEEYLEV